MIGKIKIGAGFRGVLAYNFRESKGNLIASTMAGTTARELAKEFGAIRALRPSMSRAVFHTSIAIAPGETLSDDQWRLVSDRALNGLDFEGSQSLVFRHDDAKHPHIHIVANRIRVDGTVVSDSKDYSRLEKIMRELEKELGLKIVLDSVDAPRRAPTRGELALFERTGELSTKMQLQQLCDAAAFGSTSFSDYQERLSLAGVDIIPAMKLDGEKWSGVTYRLDGVLMKGADLGKSYSPAGLSKRGVTYEQSRDYASIERCIEREKSRTISADVSPAADARTVSSAGADRGRDVADVSQFEVGRSALSGDGIDDAAKRPSVDADREPRKRERNSSDIRSDIAEVARVVKNTAGPEIARDLDAKLQAWRLQHTAIGAPLYQVSIRSADGKERLLDACDSAGVEKMLPILRQHEKRGRDIQIQSVDPKQHFIHLHGITDGQLEALHAAGFTPALVLQPGQGVHQAIIAAERTAHADDEAATHDVARAIGLQIGDVRTAIGAPMPLAGFRQRGTQTNRTIARIISAARVLCRRTQQMVLDALKIFDDHAAKAVAAAKQAERRSIIMNTDMHPGAGQIRHYMELAREFFTQSPRAEFGEIDVKVARAMLKTGLARDEVERPIATASPSAVAYGVIATDYAREVLDSALAGGSSGGTVAPNKIIRSAPK